MGILKESLAVLGLLIILIGCAGFRYKYYGLDLPEYTQGHLLGPNPADDLPISVCKPDDQAKGKCVVMPAAEFFSFKQDYEETVQRLKECQQGQ